MRRVIGLGLTVVAVGGVLGGTPAVATTSAPRATEPIVYQTLTASRENTFFDITTLYHPQVGQSLTVARPMVWTALEMGTYQVKLINDPQAYQWLVDGKYDEKWFTSYMRGYSVRARVTVEIWHHGGTGEIGDQVDLLADFTRVHQSKMSKTIPIGARVTFPIKGGVAVEPGRYFVVVGLRFTDRRVFNLRFTGQENGTNTMGGFDHDHPVPEDCADYEMTPDSHPGGKAYRPISNSHPSAPQWLAPFATSFEVVDTKVMMGCNMNGNYDPNAQIWNPGDITMAFRGRTN